jgi:hypothetical protein
VVRLPYRRRDLVVDVPHRGRHDDRRLQSRERSLGHRTRHRAARVDGDRHLAAQAAAFAVFRATRNVEDADPPPEGRLHLFSIGALVGNTLFLVIILLSEIAAVVDRACHQA